MESFWGLWQRKDHQSFLSFLVERRNYFSASTSPSPIQPLLCKFCQMIRKSVLFFFPLPVFDFFHVRYVKGLNQPYLRSEKRKLHLKCERRWNKELFHWIPKAFESTQRSFIFFAEGYIWGKKEKLICLKEWNNWASAYYCLFLFLLNPHNKVLKKRYWVQFTDLETEFEREAR